MNNPPNTRINTLEDIEKALRLLTAQGYETSGLWAEHQAYLKSLDSPQEITDDVRKYATRAEGDTSIEDHFADGQPEVLNISHITAGHQYTLSPGQRDVLRERYGLTPTTTIVVEDLGFYMGEGQLTNYVSSITIRSVVHTDPRVRTRVLNSVVLHPAWQFFRDASIKDKAREDEKAEQAVLKGEKVPKVKSPTSLALQYI